MKAGFGKRCISPPVGAPLTGFAAREGVAQGIHDDLYVRAMVLESAAMALALVSVEVLALDERFVDEAAAAISRSTGIPQPAILIAATHTHAGPVTVRTFFNPEEKLDAAYMARLSADIALCAEQAWAARVPARLGVGTARTAMGANRHDPETGPIDEEVGILRVDRETGGVLGALVNYTCHPTILGPNNLLVTGDFPTVALDRIEQGLDRAASALFFNGALGNVSVGHSSELSAIGVVTPGRTFEHAQQLGEQLGDAVLAALDGISTAPTVALEVRNVPLELPVKACPAPDVAAEARERARRRLERLSADAPEAERRRAQVDLLYASIDHANACALAQYNGKLSIRLQAFRIGDAVLLAVPAELFVEIGLTIKRQAVRPTFLIGLANGYIGYVPTYQACMEGGYEAAAALCGPDTERILVEAALKLN